MSIDHTDEDVLRELYWDKELTIQEIAGKSSVTNNAILYQMKKNNIERRDSPQKKNKNAKWRDKSLLRDLYWNEGLSIQEIADKVDTNSSDVWKQMEKNGIERRKGQRNIKMLSGKIKI